MKFVVVIVATALSAGAASAQGLESMQIANELGTVIASEEVCGLSYDQAAIEAFIAKKVSDDDMSFASTLNMMVMGTEAQIGDMSASAKTAHCAQIKRVAKSYGFTK